MGIRGHSLGVAALLVVGSLGVAVSVATPAAAAPDYPSWGDVQAAKKNVTTKKAEIVKLRSLLGDLQKQAAETQRSALQRGEAYNMAQDALDQAAARAKKLSTEADGAAKTAKRSSQQAGELVAQIARSSGGNVTLGLLTNSAGAGNLLERLGTMSKLSEQAAGVYRRARMDQNSARALRDQANAARRERASRRAAAQDALATAKLAAESANTKVTAQQKTAGALQSQLASLNGRSTTVSAGYLAGLAWEKQQAAVKTPPPPAPPLPFRPRQDPRQAPAPRSSPDSSPAVPAPGGGSAPRHDRPFPPDPVPVPAPRPAPNPVAPPAPPAPSGSGVAGAIAFARAQLGEPYVLGGMGPDTWDCSGLTKGAYASVGVYIGTHSSNNQYDALRTEGRLVALSDLQAGDLLWYSSGGSPRGDKYHVTLYIGGGRMIEAPYPGSVVRIRPVRYGDLVPYAGRPT